MTKNMHIHGRKVILDALRQNQPIQKIYVQQNIQFAEFSEIEKTARKRHIPITRFDRRKFEKVFGGKAHQGITALLAPGNLWSQEKFLETVTGLKAIKVLYADRIQDPQNLGALIRSAELLGLDAVCYPLKDSTPITPVVIKTSAGAALEIPLIGVRTPYNFLEALKKNKVQIIGALKNEQAIPPEKLSVPGSYCLIIGNEEQGIKNSLRKLCDSFVYIPQIGKTESFNASVAGGIILYEIQRGQTPGE